MEIDPRSLAASSGLLDMDPLAGLNLPAKGPSVGNTFKRGGEDTSDLFGLGRDDFFKLFLAQLRNQDPTQPIDDKEFLAQLAQFSLIDTMQEVKKALTGTQLAQASSLIGGHVQGTGIDGQPVSGVVDRLVQDEKGITLIVDGRGIRPDDVSVVTAG